MKSKKPKDDPTAVTETARGKSIKHVPERQLRNYKQLADVEPFKVAQLATTLLREGGDEIEAIRKAYTLLDIAEYCNLSLKNQASVEAGIKSYQKGVKDDAGFYAALENAPHYEYKLGPKEKGLTVPLGEGLDPFTPLKRLSVNFDVGLEAAIQLPKSTRDKPTERMTRLKRFLKEWLQETRPEMNEEDRILEAGAQIERMQRDGIEPNFVAFLKVKFPSWWEEAKARDQSVKGRHGQVVKKGKQVQVKPASNKRKARPPVEKLPEAIQQFIAENKSQA